MNIEIDDRTPIRLIGLGAAAMGCEVEAQQIPRGPFAEAVRKAVLHDDDAWWFTWLPHGAHWLDTYIGARLVIDGPETNERYAASRRLNDGGHVAAVMREAAAIESLAERFA